MAHDLFISYAQADVASAQSACQSLEAAGIKCWIEARDHRAEAIDQAARLAAVDQSRAVLFLLSPKSNQAPEVLNEAARAAQLGLPTVASRTSDFVPRADLQKHLTRARWFDAPRTGANYQGYAPLFHDLIGHSSGTRVYQPPDTKPVVVEKPATTNFSVQASTEKPAGTDPGVLSGPLANPDKPRRSWLLIALLAGLPIAFLAGLGIVAIAAVFLVKPKPKNGSPAPSPTIPVATATAVPVTPLPSATSSATPVVTPTTASTPATLSTPSATPTPSPVATPEITPEASPSPTPAQAQQAEQLLGAATNDLKAERWDEAIQKCSDVLSSDANNAFAYKLRGDGYRGKNNYDQAIADYAAAIGAKPDFAAAYNNRGIAYVKKGNQPSGVADFTKAIGLEPKFAYAYSNRATIEAEQKRYKEAIADATQAIQIEPADDEAFYVRGFCQYKQNRYQPAIQDFSEAIRLNSKAFKALAYYFRGVCSGMQRRWQAAADDISEAIRLNPNQSNFYHDRAICYRALRQPAKAREDEARVKQLQRKQ